jgi:hypothetical protein
MGARMLRVLCAVSRVLALVAVAVEFVGVVRQELLVVQLAFVLGLGAVTVGWVLEPRGGDQA